MTLYLNSILIGEYSDRSGNLNYSVVEPAGTKKSSRLAPYMNGVQHEHLTISVSTKTMWTTLQSLQALLANGEGAYFLRDTMLHIYNGQATDHTNGNSTTGCWVNVKGITYQGNNDSASQVGGYDFGKITLDCTIAIDGTGSTYNGPW